MFDDVRPLLFDLSDSVLMLQLVFLLLRLAGFPLQPHAPHSSSAPFALERARECESFEHLPGVRRAVADLWDQTAEGFALKHAGQSAPGALESADRLFFGLARQERLQFARNVLTLSMRAFPASNALKCAMLRLEGVEAFRAASASASASSADAAAAASASSSSSFPSSSPPPSHPSASPSAEEALRKSTYQTAYQLAKGYLRTDPSNVVLCYAYADLERSYGKFDVVRRTGSLWCVAWRWLFV